MPIKLKEFSIMNVKALDIVEHNALPISKNQLKRLSISWSDEGSDPNVQPVKTWRWSSDIDSWNEEITYDEIASSHKDLCIKSEEVCQ